jgi:hypothetical protein
MKTRISLILAFILLSGISLTFAQTVTDTAVVDYKIIDRTVQDKISRYGADQVLVVMDIDNTILTSDSDLGSDFWYQWQNGDFDLKPTPEQKLTKDCMYNEAIGLLYELSSMKLTDSLLPGYISGWQKSGVTVFALTSRSPKYRAATERELKRNHVDLSLSPLNLVDGGTLNFHFTMSRELSYVNGIFMTTGMNKGEMLAHIIGRSGRSFKSIIFVDDTRKNIDAVKTKYSDCGTTDLVLFNYTKILTDRLKRNNNVVLTPRQAEKMDQDWDLLVNTLMTIFPERMAKSECSK